MKLFVAGLPYDMDDAELEEFFEKFGAVVSAKISLDKETGKSRGFAFVEMPNAQEAREAIDGLNNLAIGKKALVVKEAEERRGTGFSTPARPTTGPRFSPGSRPPRDRY